MMTATERAAFKFDFSDGFKGEQVSRLVWGTLGDAFAGMEFPLRTVDAAALTLRECLAALARERAASLTWFAEEVVNADVPLTQDELWEQTESMLYLDEELLNIQKEVMAAARAAGLLPQEAQ